MSGDSQEGEGQETNPNTVNTDEVSSWCSQERQMKVIPKHLLTDGRRPIRDVSALLQRTEHSVLVFLLQHSVK